MCLRDRRRERGTKREKREQNIFKTTFQPYRYNSLAGRPRLLPGRPRLLPHDLPGGAVQMGALPGGAQRKEELALADRGRAKGYFRVEK